MNPSKLPLNYAFDEDNRKQTRALRSLSARMSLVVLSVILASNAVALDLMITSNKDPAQDATSLTYTMTVANPTGSTQTNVVLEAVIPTYMTVSPGSEASPAGTCLDLNASCGAGEIIQWTLGNIGPGELRVVRFSGYISSGANDGDMLTAEAMVIADGVSAVQDSHSVIVSEGTPALQLALASDHNPAEPNGLVTYRLRYSNGSADLTATSLTASLPVGTSFISTTGGGAAIGDTVSWPVSVGPGTYGSREFTVQVNDTLTDGTLLRSEAQLSDTINGTSAKSGHVVAVQSASPLDLMITSNKDPAQDATSLTYTMTVANPTGSTQTNVVLEAVIPTYMTVSPGSEASPAGTCLDLNASCGAGEIIQWTLGNIGPGELRVVRFSGYISSSANDGDMLTAEAMVIADGVSAVQDTHSVIVSENTPALQLALASDHNPAEPNGLVTYRLRYSNGSADLTATSLTASLPVGTSFISTTGGGAAIGDTVSWPVSVGPGTYGSREFTVQVNDTLTDGTLLRSEAQLSDTINGTSAKSGHVVAVQSASPLDLMITSNKDPAQDATSLTYTMTVANPTGSTQTNVVLEAVIPTYMTVSPGSEASPAGTCLDLNASCGAGEIIQWTLGNIGPGELRVVRFSGYISSSANDGDMLTAEAMVIADGVSAVQDTHSVIVSENTPALQLALASDHNPAEPNGLVTYRLRYSNGSADLTATSLTASLPVGTSFISTTGGGAAIGDTVSWPVSVGPGTYGSREFTVQVNDTLTDGTLLRSEAQLSDTINGTSAKSGHVVAVQSASPLDLMITSNKDPVQDATSLTYTMTVANPTGSTQTNVVLEAVIPTYMTVSPGSEASPAGTCLDLNASCGAGEIIQWTLGNIGPGELRVVRFSGYISSSANDGDMLTAEAMVIADGVSAVQDSHSVIVSEGLSNGLLLKFPVPGFENSQPSQDYGTFAALVDDQGQPIEKHHAGMDFVAPVGTDVVAAAGGTAYAYRLANLGNKNHCLGNAVVIDHGEHATLYAHLDSIPAAITDTGIEVAANDKIGEVGNSVGDYQSGAPCPVPGAHLHFEVKEDPVLDNPSGLGQMWGYTPENAGNTVPEDHPDFFGYFDPVLNLHGNMEFSTAYRVEVSSIGGGATLRTGPGTNYRSIGSTTIVEQEYDPIREYNIGTASCPRGWIQVRNVNGQYFDDTGGGSVPEAWICRGLVNEQWLLLSDGDGIPAEQDNCPQIDNPGQADFDLDGVGDDCDSDDDNDGVPDHLDQFPYDPDRSADSDGDGIADEDDLDADGDGTQDAVAFALAERYMPVLRFSEPGGIGNEQGVDLTSYENCHVIDNDGSPTIANDYLPMAVTDLGNRHPSRSPLLSIPPAYIALSSTEISSLGVYGDPDAYVDLEPLYDSSLLLSKRRRIEQGYCGLPIQPTIYFKVFHNPAQAFPYAIQYWFFYFDNDWSTNHAGDWESISIFLDENQLAVEAAFSTHFEANRYDWATEISRYGGTDRPYVYVSNGGHGSYASPGTTPFGIVNDNHNGQGSILTQYNLQPLPTDASMQSWLYFPGRWGQDSTSPTGPIGRTDARNEYLWSISRNKPRQHNCDARFGIPLMGFGQLGPWDWASGYRVGWAWSIETTLAWDPTCVPAVTTSNPTPNDFVSDDVSFAWTEIADVQTYRLKIRTSDGALIFEDTFDSSYCNAGVCSTSKSLPLVPGQRYYWWMRPDTGTVKGPWSNFNHFTRIIDTDNDGIADHQDPDDDNDGVPDGQDDYPLGRFDDARPTHWAFFFIETLARAGVTSGCGNGDYCPNNIVTRAQMAVFLERGMRGSDYTPPPATGNVFLDVDANDFAASFIEQLYADGITSGCGNQNFCPSDGVTRAQMAVFLLRAKHGSDYVPPSPVGAFNDVDTSYWAAGWIEQLAAEGITSGCGSGNYCPDDIVTRAQMAVFLVRAFDLDGLGAKVGIWEGIGIQDGQSWTIRIDLSRDSQIVDYPSLACGGNLNLVEASPDRLLFYEVINYGTQFCVDSGYTELLNRPDGQLTYQYYLEAADGGIGALIATGSVEKVSQ